MKHDLTLLEEFGEALKPADEHPPAEVRHRVMNAMRRRPKAATRPLGTRLAWRIGAPATAAAAIAAGLIAGNMANVAGNAPAPPSASSSAGTGTPAPAGAGLVLQLAAQHADATAQLDARDDQFLYIEAMEVRTRLRGRNSDQVQIIGPVRVRTWLSVDGTRDGLVSDAVDGDTRLSGCRNGLRAETIDRPDTTPMVPCTPEPAYRLTPVPTDPDELLAYLYDSEGTGDHYVWILPPGSRTGGVGVKLSEHQRAFQKLTGLLYQNHSPALQAAALRAAARIPGVEVVRGVRDAAGRTGVAVARTEAGTREELVFDERTYAFLGHNSTVAELDLTGVNVTAPPVGEIDAARIDIIRHRKPGDVIQKWAILRIDIVDRAGQRP
jgi:hypothetical protein